MAGPGHDARFAIYEDLHHEQLARQGDENRASARLILPLLFEHYRPKSVLDVGCGLGTWLAVAQELGVKEIAGVEGAWLDRKLAQVPADRITTLDLERPFDLGRRFDLAICLEVAEHLSPEAAEGFVGSLARHADAVLFSAAIPLQGGHHHVNEQFPDYWERIFDAEGYVALDFIRPAVWYSAEVLVWLRQNILVFAKEALTRPGAPFAAVAEARPLALVHPEFYMWKLESVRRALEEHAMLVEWLSSGKTVSAVRRPDGSLELRTGGEEN